MKFSAISKNGGLEFTDYTRAVFKKWLLNNPGARLEISAVLPESRNQRRYFEGCIVPLITFYQENLDYRDREDCKRVREWLKSEFNGEFCIVRGKQHRIAKTTSGGHLKAFLERVIDWLIENYAPPEEALKPECYQKWRDEVFPFGGAETYIGYLLDLRIIKK